jgi:hypothetical protein
MSPSTHRIPACLIAICCGALAATAAQTHTIGDVSYADFQAGTLENLALHSSGSLQTAPALRKIAQIDEPVLWDAVADAAGNLYLGTGNRGRVWKIDNQGSSEMLFQPDAILSRGLALDADGRLYVATSPHGAVYRIPAGGGFPELVFDPDDTYIWNLHIADGILWVATGMQARLWRVPLDPAAGKAEIWFSARETHFTALAATPEGTILLGGSPQGILYEVSGKDDGRALYRSAEQEIRNIEPLADGRIWFSSLSIDEPRAGSRREQDTTGSAATDDDMPPIESASAPLDTPSAQPSARTSAPVQAPTAGRSFLYLRDPDGFVQPVWQGIRESISSLHRLRDRFWLVGSNREGRLYAIEGRDRWARIQGLPAGAEVARIIQDPLDPAALLVFASQPAAVYRLGGRDPAPGVFTSAVKDATQWVRWGAIEATIEGVAGLQVETRSGNTPETDATWSAWAPVEADASDHFWRGRVPSPDARYLQYRLTLPDGSGDGAIHRVRIFLQLPNRAPVVTDLRVFPFGLEAQSTASPGRPVDFEALFKNEPVDRIFAGGGSARTQFTRLPDAGLRSIAWRAWDANGDRLRATVSLRRDGETDWTVLAHDIEDSHYVLATPGLTEGVYRLRVAVSDWPDNPGDQALTGERLSQPFIIDHQPPEIDITEQNRAAGRWRLAFSVRDRISVIRSVEGSVNGATPVTLLPEDGLYDSRDASFVWTGEVEPQTPLQLQIFATDEAGRQARTVVTLPPE